MKTALSVQTAKPTVDIIIVTYNNFNMLDRCLRSLYENTKEPIRIIVVNNGDQKFAIETEAKDIHILHMTENLGWTQGVNVGLKWALKNDPANFIMWLNDDIQILPHDYGWLTKMLNCFQLDPKIAVVGPTSNNVMGFQTTNHTSLPPAIETTYISGMCMLTRRSIIEELGPLDSGPAGGDDLDFCMRLTKKGYKICICRRAFMLHFCSVTGKRLFGEYWNSPQQGEDINNWLIKKHGFKAWYVCINNELSSSGYDFISGEEKLALDALKSILDSNGKILDLGCGGKKIHEKVIGVDIRKNGQMGVGANLAKACKTDIEADILSLPFEDNSIDGILAKHLFEHILDPIKALQEWKRVLKECGTLVIACPDYRYCEAISVDPSHVHAYTPESISSLLTICGFNVIQAEQVLPGYVFVITAINTQAIDIVKLLKIEDTYKETIGYC